MKTLPPATKKGKREPARNNLVESAIEYAGKGWLALPVHSASAEGCTCGNRDCKNIGKHPRTEHGRKDASLDPSVIRGWWTKWPNANIGIATGPGSGIFVLDVDGEEGQMSLKALEGLPPTLRVLSGRIGPDKERNSFHLYFHHPTGVDLNNRPGFLGAGLDVRGLGVYVVAPPSLHSSGLRYEWANEDTPIADAPPWLIAMATKSAKSWNRTVETLFIYEGERDAKLYRLAAKWRREGAPECDVVSRLRAVNRDRCRPPLGDSQLLKNARSAMSVAVGSLDPLETAWEKAKAEGHWCAYDKLLALIRHLEIQRPGFTMLLPVERIGKLLGCDRTLVGRHRMRAIAEGYIEEVGDYIPHQKAKQYKVLKLPPSFCL